MRVWEIGSGPALAFEVPLDADSEQAVPWVALIGPLAPPVGAFHPQQAVTARGGDGRGMSFAMHAIP